jgi:hypothetical protein
MAMAVISFGGHQARSSSSSNIQIFYGYLTKIIAQIRVDTTQIAMDIAMGAQEIARVGRHGQIITLLLYI